MISDRLWNRILQIGATNQLLRIIQPIAIDGKAIITKRLKAKVNGTGFL